MKKDKNITRYDYYYSFSQNAILENSARRNSQVYKIKTANGKQYTLVLKMGSSVDEYRKNFPDIRLVASDAEQLCELAYGGIPQKRII